jgi:hypothetical protein
MAARAWMMIDIVIIYLMKFFILGFGTIEIFCFFMKRNRLKRPYLISITVGLIIGVFYFIRMLNNQDAEGTMIVTIFAPVFISIFSLPGVVIGCVYKEIDRTIFIKKLD